MSNIFIDKDNAENILQRMWEQCEREQFCDFVLIAGIEEIPIPAHRSVLSAKSEYFETMFTSPSNKSTAREVKLPRVDGEIVKTIVKYCYTGHIEIRGDNVEKLLETAGYFLLVFIVNACKDFLAEQLQPTDCLVTSTSIVSKIFIDKDNAENILQRMWVQCECEQFFDVVLIAGIEEMRIPANRSVLSAKSEYFETMFTSQLNESTAKEVKLFSVDCEIVKTIVKYCYKGHIEIKEDNVEKLLETAGYLLLAFIVNACGDFLAEQLHPTNCLGFALLAERHHCESLLKQATNYSYIHFVELFTTDEFLDLNVKQLGRLLASDLLYVPAEEYVFSSLMAWLKHNRFEREQHKYELFKLLRLPLMKSSFLIQDVRPECTSADCHQIYKEAMEWHSLPKLRTLNASKTTKPRSFNQFLVAITSNRDSLEILYHCPQKLKWMKWLSKDIRFRYLTDFAVMKDELFLLGHLDVFFEVVAVICLNLTTMTLKDVRVMNTCVRNSVAVVKGSLYAVGTFAYGINEDQYLDLSDSDEDQSVESYDIISGRIVCYVEKFDSETNTWNLLTPMSVFRSDFRCVAVNEKLYVIGGCDSKRKALKSADYYDTEDNVWTSIAAMNVARIFPGVAVVNGMLYAMGGEENITVERYDTKTDKWTIICSLSGCFPGLRCTAFNDKLLVIDSDRVEECNLLRNEWKVNTSIKGLRCYGAFCYSGELLVSKFVES